MKSFIQNEWINLRRFYYIKKLFNRAKFWIYNLCNLWNNGNINTNVNSVFASLLHNFLFCFQRLDRSLAFLILEIQCINHFVSPDQYTILIIFILQFDCGIILELLTYIISCYILQMTKNYC